MKQWKTLRFFGSDARDFLHRVTAGTVKKLKASEGAGGLLCNGQSRMIAQFDLLCRNDEDFVLVSPEECFEELKKGLEKLHFAESIEMQEMGFAFLRKEAGKERSEIFSWSEEGWPSAVPGYVYVWRESESPKEDEFPEDYEFDRILAGIPSPKDWDKDTPALEAGMLLWIDRNKGCYPGQEVVELSLNVGKPARALVVWEGKSSVAPGKIPLEGGGEALLTSVAEKKGRWLCFARVPWKKRDLPAAGFQKIR